MIALSVQGLTQLREAGQAHELVDVRTEQEREFASIDASTFILDDGEQERLLALPRDTTLVFYCHHGVRSRNVGSAFERQGFTRVHNLEGGIDAWSSLIDPDVPRY